MATGKSARLGSVNTLLGRWIAVGACLALALSCNRKTYEDPRPGPSSSQSVTYPLTVSFGSDVAGSFQLIRQEDGTALGRLSLTGTKPGRRYFGNISYGSASVLTATAVLADLNETDATGLSTTWLFEDYLNKPIRYDSLLTANAMVKVLEVNPAETGYKEVLRGDIGSNVLTTESKTFAFEAVNGSGVSGTVTLRARANGNFLATTTLKGLPAGAFSPVRLLLGSTDDPSQARTLTRLNPVNAASGTSTSEVAGLSGGLAALDTLNGFFAVGYSQGQPDSLLALAPLGPNQATGAAQSVTLYGTDSSSVLQLVLRQYRSGAWKPTVTAQSLAGVGPFYLTLHRGTVLQGSSPVGVWPIAIASRGTAAAPGLSFSGKPFSLDSLAMGDYHFLLTEDTINYAGYVGSADIGRNALSGTAQFVTLSEYDPVRYPRFKGKASIRERKSGRCLIRLVVDRTEAGFDHVLNLRSGAFTPGGSQGPLLYKLSTIPGLNGTGADITLEPQGTASTPLPYAAFQSGQYLELEEEESSGQPLCGGNLP